MTKQPLCQNRPLGQISTLGQNRPLGKYDNVLFGLNIQLCRPKEPLGQNRLRGQNSLLEKKHYKRQ